MRALAATAFLFVPGLAVACGHGTPPPMVPDPPEPIVSLDGGDASAAPPVVSPSPTAEPPKP